MALQADELLKRPLYIFDLPPELLVTLQLKTLSLDSHPRDDSHPVNGTSQDKELSSHGNIEQKASTSCALCSASFPNVQEQRQHIRSDWHGYNLKQKLRGQPSATEVDFEKLVEDLDESISGSESSELDDDDERKDDSTLTALLKKQAYISNASNETDIMPKRRKRGSGKPPILWFATSLLPSNTSLGIYRALFTEAEQDEDSHIVDAIRQKQLPPAPEKPVPSGSSNGVPLLTTMTAPHIFLCMIGGGHFAAMIVSLTQNLEKKATGSNARQAIVLAHKTFHRYTTRRKQGGSQSANDSAKGAAHSAGSSLRRYNEVALEAEIRALLREWRHMIDKTQLIFVRATGSSNRRTLFGPYEDQVLRHNDPRNRSFPFSTRRATQAELMRAFVELTRVKVSEVDEAALATAAAAEETSNSSTPKPPTQKPTNSKLTKEEESLQLHTTQLQSLIRRSKAPALLTYLTTHSLPPNFIFEPCSTQANHHAPRPLHLAASTNSSAVISALLTKTAADPTIENGEGKVPFDLSGDRVTRDAFRVARHELGEDRWNWNAAHVPPPLTKAEAEQRESRERAEAEKAESERRKAEGKRLEEETKAAQKVMVGKKGVGRTIGVEKTGAEKREEEVRGLTPEMRMKLERERRARAAEERMGRIGTGGGGR